MPITRVLTCDPGGMSGMAVYVDGQVNAWQSPWAQAQDECSRYIVESRPQLVVCEDFIITAATSKKSQDGKKSIESMGVLRHECRREGIEFITQQPSEAKSFSTNEKLKRIGWWIPGEDHSRDALRHLLLVLASRRIIDIRPLLSS